MRNHLDRLFCYVGVCRQRKQSALPKGAYHDRGLTSGFKRRRIHFHKQMAWDEWKTMPWKVVTLYIALLLALWTDVTNCIVLPAIHWNGTNPMFKTSNNDHLIEVNMFDEIDFVCPHFYHWEEQESYEYYIIHQVSKREYDDCNLYPNDGSSSSAIMIVNCSSPREKKRFTILFEPFASIPNVPEYKPGGTYYYITTSTGRREGISNLHQGACLYKNMRLTMKVCCEPTTTPMPTNLTSSAMHVITSTPSPTTTEQTAFNYNGTEGEGGVVTKATTRRTPPSTRPTIHLPRTTPTPPKPTTVRRPDKTTTSHPGQGDPGGKPDKDIDKNKDQNEVYNPKQEGLVNSAWTLSVSQFLTGSSLAIVLTFWTWQIR